MNLRASVLIVILAWAGVGFPPARGAACRPQNTSEPRTLVLALDGVPLRAIEQARARGAFEGWPEALPLVSTFPSLTNVAFTAMFQPMGVEPARGYEVQHFDIEKNSMTGKNPFKYEERLFAWRDIFDVTGRSVGGKLSIYTSPVKSVWKEIELTEEHLLDSPKELVLAHIGATDALIHLRGVDRIVDLLVELDEYLVGLRQRHLEQTGRGLRFVLLSDHGNTSGKVRAARGIPKTLREAGLRLVSHLEEPNDVVAPTFGLVSYGALYLYPERAGLAARAVVRHEAVEIAAWVSGDSEVRVVSDVGEAKIRWRDTPEGRELAYLTGGFDPLKLEGSRARLLSQGLVDSEGFAPQQAWLAASALADYPAALSRLVDSLTAPWVENHGTVMFSLAPGYAWGWRSAHASSLFTGGRIEGTHGGLDRDSSLAFYLADDPELTSGVPKSAVTALAEVADMNTCPGASIAETAAPQTPAGF